MDQNRDQVNRNKSNGAPFDGAPFDAAQGRQGRPFGASTSLPSTALEAGRAGGAPFDGAQGRQGGLPVGGKKSRRQRRWEAREERREMREAMELADKWALLQAQGKPIPEHEEDGEDVPRLWNPIVLPEYIRGRREKERSEQALADARASGGIRQAHAGEVQGGPIRQAQGRPIDPSAGIPSTGLRAGGDQDRQGQGSAPLQERNGTGVGGEGVTQLPGGLRQRPSPRVEASPPVPSPGVQFEGAHCGPGEGEKGDTPTVGVQPEGGANSSQGASSQGVFGGNGVGQGKEEGALGVIPQSQGALRQAQGSVGAEGENALARFDSGQVAALDYLARGMSVTEAARVAGLSRSTVYRWVKEDAAFKAALNRWKDEIEESSRNRLLTLTQSAMDSVERAMERGDGRLGLQLLKGLGLVKPGETLLLEEGEVAKRMELDRRAKQLKMEVEGRKLNHMRGRR